MSPRMDSSASASSVRGNGRSGPRASLACLNCRARKIKCRMPEPNAPACVSCRSLELHCIINKDGDRRKAGSRQHVAALQERLDYLESYIAKGHHKNGSPSIDPSMSSGLVAPTAGPELSPAPSRNQRSSLDGSNSVSEDGKGRIGSITVPHGHQHIPPAAITIGHADSTPPFHHEPRPGHAFQAGVAGRPDIGRLTPSSDGDPSRLDLDEADGQPRLYGPTSQPYIQRHSVQVESEDLTSDDQSLNIDSTPLRAVLFTTYWKIQPHSIIIVDETLFTEGREAGHRSEYYSAFLGDAVLACATRLSTSDGVRALGARYVDRAKAAITMELERPNTATLQGFLLLSDFEATRGRDRLGYLYSGIASRLVFDLGLPESCADLVAKGKLSTSEAMWRHTLFLGTFVYDKLWSLYLGRPGTIPTTTVETAHGQALASGWRGPSTLQSWAGLCYDISDATDILNRASGLDDEAKHRLASLDARIQQRSEQLPAEIFLNKDRIGDLPPNAYSLHIQFHGIRVVLHRLLYKAALHQPVKSQADQDHQNRTIERSRAIVYDHAVQIAQLVTVYQQIFGIEQVITIMLDNSYVAAAVLTSHVVRTLQQGAPPETVEKDLQRLRAIADMLLKAQRHYPVTVRIRFTLSSLVDQTPLAGMFGHFAQTSHAQQGGGGAVTELQPNASVESLAELNSDIAQEIAGLRPDMALFQDWVTDSGDPIFQEMDWSNMMSWALSPNNVRTEVPFQ